MGIDAGIFFKEFMRSFIFGIFLELVELLVLRCFAPGSLNDLLFNASSQSTAPLQGSCLRPGVVLDCVMGQCSLLAIFTFLVSCPQQDGGSAFCSIVKL